MLRSCRLPIRYYMFYFLSMYLGTRQKHTKIKEVERYRFPEPELLRDLFSFSSGKGRVSLSTRVPVCRSVYLSFSHLSVCLFIIVASSITDYLSISLFLMLDFGITNLPLQCSKFRSGSHLLKKKFSV